MTDQLVTDLAKAMVQKPATTGLGIGSATILAWDSTTLRSTVLYEGAELQDLPVLSATDALTYQPGDEVILQMWHPPDGHRRRGFGSYFILGRAVRPGAANAQRIIQFLQTQLAKQIARSVIAETMRSESKPLIDGTVSNPGATYVAADGPALTGIEISEAGICLLQITARIGCQINQPLGVSASGWMSFRITGATTVEPADDESLNHDIFGPAADVIVSTVQATRLVLVEGLNPGVHTIEAQYRSEHIDPPPQTSVIFSSRNLTVWAL